MRPIPLLAVTALNLIAVGNLCAQQPEQKAPAVIQPGMAMMGWTVDRSTGALHAVALTGKDGESSADLISTEAGSTVTYTGTVNMTLTVKLVSAQPKNPQVNCNGSVSLGYTVEGGTTVVTTLVGLGGGVSEGVEGTVVGDMATCKFSMPYSFSIPATSATQLVVVRGLNAAASVSEFTAPSTTTTSTGVSRSTSVTMGSTVGAPAEGAVTTFTANTVL